MINQCCYSTAGGNLQYIRNSDDPGEYSYIYHSKSIDPLDAEGTLRSGAVEFKVDHSRIHGEFELKSKCFYTNLEDLAGWQGRGEKRRTSYIHFQPGRSLPCQVRHMK